MAKTKTTGPNVERLLPGQARLYKLEKKYKGFIGGVGSGKTRVGALWATIQVLHFEGDGMIVSPTYRMLEDVTLRAFTELLDRLNRPYTYVRTRQVVTVGDNSVFFRSAEHPDRLRGPNLSWAWLDEAALMREIVWPIMMGRLRLNDARALITTTPSGFNWVYKYFVEMQNESYGLIRASSRENIYLDEDFVQNLEASYTSEFAAQEIEGHFVLFEGAIYPEFSTDADHGNVQDVEIKEGWERVRAIDFGYTNPFVCLWGALDEDGRLYIYDEHYIRNRLLSEHASSISNREGTFTWTAADWDAQGRAELNAAGVSTVRAKKDVQTGIQKVKARLQKQPDGLPRLVIHPRCANLIKEFGSYRWNPTERGGKEEPIKENDHAMDALRYMVMGADQGGFVIL